MPNNGAGKKYAGYIKITHNGETLCLHSDAMEPEDAIFGRDLSWIDGLLKECYEIGKMEGKTVETAKALCEKFINKVETNRPIQQACSAKRKHHDTINHQEKP